MYRRDALQIPLGLTFRDPQRQRGVLLGDVRIKRQQLRPGGTTQPIDGFAAGTLHQMPRHEGTDPCPPLSVLRIRINLAAAFLEYHPQIPINRFEGAKMRTSVRFGAL